MRNRIIFKIIMSVLLIPLLGIYAQIENVPGQFPDLIQFYLETLNYSSSQTDSSRLEVFIEVPYRRLHFVNDAGVFRAKYELTVSIFDSMNNLVQEKTWIEKLQTADYDESMSLKISNVSQKSFILFPSKYTVTVQMQETETPKASRVNKMINAKNFSQQPFTMSDIMLVKRINEEGKKKVIYPNISRRVGESGDSFYFFYEIYNHCNADSAMAGILLKNIKGEIVYSDTQIQSLEDKKNTCFHKINIAQLIMGEYTSEITVHPLGLEVERNLKEITVSASKEFVVFWRSAPFSGIELEEAIDPLIYIIEREKLDEIKNAPIEKKKGMFHEFWKKRDPSPDTDRNEMMEEYYARVEFTNKNFSHHKEGWKTDRGMIYIIFGPPDNIERHPFEINTKPYEVWSYYGINREFIFVDDTGFGDYRLQNPDWDIWRYQPR